MVKSSAQLASGRDKPPVPLNRRGQSGVLSGIGTHLYRPQAGGGKVGPATTEELISVVNVGGREELFYPSMPINVAFLRGSRADVDGNISMEDEANFQDSLAQAQAVHNCGSIVIVQVMELVDRNSLDPQTIHSGIFVDYLVLSTPDTHWQTYGEVRNNTYTGRSRSDTPSRRYRCAPKKSSRAEPCMK